jgi:aldehyde dehydrogenase (NAD+)
MGKSLLELGGNNALIIDNTADLKLAIPAVVFGSVGTAGQRCTSTRRLFVQDDIFSEVKDKLVQAYGQVTIGDPLDAGTLMGPLTDEAAVQDYLDAIENACNDGGEVLCGGNRIDGPGYFVEPAIVKAENKWDIVQSETFAPILYMIPFKTMDEVITMQNGVAQGLSSALFTRDVRNAEYFLSAVGSDCGIANINIGTSGAEIGAVAGNPALIHGRRICAGKPIPLTGAMSCRWLRA